MTLLVLKVIVRKADRLTSETLFSETDNLPELPTDHIDVLGIVSVCNGNKKRLHILVYCLQMECNGLRSKYKHGMIKSHFFDGICI